MSEPLGQIRRRPVEMGRLSDSLGQQALAGFLGCQGPWEGVLGQSKGGGGQK